MTRIVKAVASVGFVLGLVTGGTALTFTNAAAKCWTESTNYTGQEGDPEDCLGGGCTEGWCCLICTIEPTG